MNESPSILPHLCSSVTLFLLRIEATVALFVHALKYEFAAQNQSKIPHGVEWLIPNMILTHEIKS